MTSSGRWTRMAIVLVFLGLAIWVIQKSYVAHFSGPVLTESQQAELGIRLLDFPRDLPELQAKPTHVWRALYLVPDPCSSECQSQNTGLSHMSVKLVSPEDAQYSDIQSITGAEGYSYHQNRVWLIDDQGRFAGSIAPPYEKARLHRILHLINHLSGDLD